MSWFALLLIGMAVSDLCFSVRPARVVPEVVGALVTLILGIGLCGLHHPLDIFALLLIAGAVVAWGQSVTWGFGRGPAWLPLTVGGASLTLAFLASGWAHDPVAGPFATWLGQLPWPALAQLDPGRALLLTGVLLWQMSTGNVVVRLVLATTGSRNPRPAVTPHLGSGAVDHGQDDVRPLKGGRLLGPMERLLIVGLGLAGQVTAASVVVAAKGLLRFPELQAAREETSPGIHEVTEYFLVGSFVSWLVALSGLVLASV